MNKKNVNKSKTIKIIKIVTATILCVGVAFFVFLFSYTGGEDVQWIHGEPLNLGQSIFIDEFNNKSFNFINDEFKILQLTDIHYGNGWFTKSKDKKALIAVKELIEYTKPDIIVITGDIAYPMPFQTGSRNNLKQYQIFASFMEEFEIPWTIVFGNHDAEVFATNTKQDIGNYLQSLKYCFFELNDVGITGLGNNFVDIYSDGELNTTLALFDAGRTIKNKQILGYEKIEDDQVDWYKNNIEKISQKYSDFQSLAFMHVPQREYQEAWEKYKQGSDEVVYNFGGAGELNEKISCPKEQSALFDKMVELGNTKAIFCGHDHLNDFSITYKGIQLVFSKSIDYTAYIGIEKKTNQRGATLITINKDKEFNVESIKLSDIT